MTTFVSRRAYWSWAFGLWWALSAVAPAQADEQRANGARSERASWLAGRLIAPCCWTQTLDIHDSPLAAALRAEIGERLARGDTPSAIESDLEVRYGAQIRAVPADRDPRLQIVIAVALGMLVSGTMLLAFTRTARSQKRVSDARAERELPDAVPDNYDARLDAELSRADKYT